MSRAHGCSTLRPRPSGLQPLESRMLLAADPIITEIVASNQTTLDDGFGNSSDWIEVYNAGDVAVDLADYHLTDSADDLTKWTFTQSFVLDPGAYGIVFASGLDTVDPAGFVHTSFSLSAGGEHVALVNPDGEVVSSFGDNGADYPEQVGDVAYGLPGVVLIDADSPAEVLVPGNGALGTSWTLPGFDAAASGFTAATSSIGYEADPGSNGGFGGLIGTTLPVGTVGAYQRIDFNIDDVSQITGLQLLMQSDDGFIAYLNGVRVAELFAPAVPQYNSNASDQRSDQDGATPLAFSLDGDLGLLNTGNNVLAIHTLNRGSSSSDMLSIATLNASVVGNTAAYLQYPTPGASNAPATQVGPQISVEDPAPTAVVPTDAPLTIHATVSAFANPVDASTVTLHYRTGFGAEVAVGMIELPDGRFSAQVPASAIQPGEMTRWYVTAQDTQGITGRGPRFLDPLNSPEYFGVVGDDPSIDTDLTLIQWFIEDIPGSFTDAGARASIVVRGVFYDNVDVNAHGQSTRQSVFIKKSFDFDANSGEKFDLGDGVPAVSDFNLLTNYADQTKLRHTLANKAFELAGHAHLLAEPVTVYRNGVFYGLFDLVEEGDSEQLERLGLDPNNALYKVNNPLNSVFNNVSKESRKFEDFSDFAGLVAGEDLNGTAARIYDFDNLDIAAWINYIAVNTVIGNADYGHKNQFMYRDSTGTGQWSAFPWDLDLSFGHNWTGSLGGNAYFDPAVYTNNSVTHALNGILSRLVNDPVLGQAYRQRVVNLTEQLLGASGTPAADSALGTLANAFRLQIADEAAADQALWGLHSNYSQSPDQAIDQLIDTFILQRRNNLLNGQLAGYSAQAGNPPVEFGVGAEGFDVEPISGDLAEQYLTITNPTSTPVDMSGWTLGGGIDHTLSPGTVLAAGQTIYITADVQAFLQRATGPTGGQQRFVQGNFTGQLTANGEVVELRGADGALVDSLTMPDNQGDLHLDQLRVTELNYNPPGSGDPTEFIEFTNVSDTHTLDLEGVTIADGPSSPFVFGAGVTLFPGQSLVVVSNTAGFSAVYPHVAVAGEFTGALSNGGETLEVTDPNGVVLLSFDYDDEDGWPTTPDGEGPSLTLIDPTADVADLGIAANWRPSFVNGGTPGTTDEAVIGDFNHSGQVEQGDLDLVLQNWGTDTEAAGIPVGWINDLAVGQIEQSELDKVLQNWGSTNTPAALTSPVGTTAPLAATASVDAVAQPFATLSSHALNQQVPAKSQQDRRQARAQTQRQQTAQPKNVRSRGERNALPRNAATTVAPITIQSARTARHHPPQSVWTQRQTQQASLEVWLEELVESED